MMSETKQKKQSKTNTSTLPKPPEPKQLPPWKVLLHNDDVNDMGFVVETICMVTPLDPEKALTVMLEAHLEDVALLLVTHQELAELYQEQMLSRGLIVTIEQAD